ncbi:MAG: hypothetical protein GXY55_12660 [Phycisphaerae bacterium]|nr:hypothetical protein [Phycisphaerae bacterium]
MTVDKARTAIKTACQQRGWQVMDLARKFEVSPEAIRRFMPGRGELSTRVLCRLPKAVDIDPSHAWAGSHRLRRSG